VAENESEPLGKPVAELIPIPFGILLKRMVHEYARSETIFDLPKRKFYRPDDQCDLAVSFCGNPASNPLGPAAGPHTQLAQNIVLSWLAGARIIELKTVQRQDRLELTRPCIDMATVGYNTEWSQELRLDESLREYVKASMMIEILRRWLFNSGADSHAGNLDTIFDVSVGYDLEGIQSMPIRNWLKTMRNAGKLIDELRKEIPEELDLYRDYSFKSEISNSITLSTFHGTPANEIEHICEFLLSEMGYHVIIKMNPPMLGKDRLEYLLHDKLGYTDIEVNQKVYDVNISFADAVTVVRRLQATAARLGKTIGVKFGNTLEVVNNGKFLKDKIQYLSGQPLHILHLALVDEWRKVFGPDFPISFSAGVDANNFADCVSIGLVPVTVCTDLLRPGGYGRLPQYLNTLQQRMKAQSARSIPEFIKSSKRASAKPGLDDSNKGRSILTSELLAKSIENPRYHAKSNQKPPRKIGSHLYLWDCVNCDKCIPVCPNDANFSFEIQPVDLRYKNIRVSKEGWSESDAGEFAIQKAHQIATFADACNECGNCDVFCPEDGGPYIEKPRFFGSLDSWQKWKHLNGFVLLQNKQGPVLHGRFKDIECTLHVDNQTRTSQFEVSGCTLTMDRHSGNVIEAKLVQGSSEKHIDLRYYHVMTTLLEGMLRTKGVHFVNAGFQNAGKVYA
jgi:putative selenate reductase